jgi:hypothetical protein
MDKPILIKKILESFKSHFRNICSRSDGTILTTSSYNNINICYASSQNKGLEKIVAQMGISLLR